MSIVLCRYQQSEAGTARWVIRLDEGLKPDITIAVRLDETNTGIRDYYLLPAMDMTWGKLRMAEANGVYLDMYQFEALDYFYGMAARCRLEDCSMREEVKMIPIESIRILNPRYRDQKKFQGRHSKHQKCWLEETH